MWRNGCRTSKIYTAYFPQTLYIREKKINVEEKNTDRSRILCILYNEKTSLEIPSQQAHEHGKKKNMWEASAGLAVEVVVVFLLSVLMADRNEHKIWIERKKNPTRLTLAFQSVPKLYVFVCSARIGEFINQPAPTQTHNLNTAMQCNSFRHYLCARVLILCVFISSSSWSSVLQSLCRTHSSLP